MQTCGKTKLQCLSKKESEHLDSKKMLFCGQERTIQKSHHKKILSTGKKSEGSIDVY
jgi:hypothetical protein